jgi:hypothetical protein
MEMMANALLSDNMIIVYTRLASMAGRKGFWFGTSEMLRKSCGMGHGLLSETIKSLEEEKLILVQRGEHRIPHRHGGGANVYRFLGHRLFQTAKRRA